MSNSDENKKLFISHENINAVKNDEFLLKDIPSLNKSNFELKNYYKSTKNITDIMNEEKFNIINEIKELNDSVNKSRNININGDNNNKEDDLQSNSSIESLCPKDTNIYLKPMDWNKTIDIKSFNKLIMSIMNNEEILRFKKDLEKLNLTSRDCDDKILFNNIGPLNKYEDENEICTTIISNRSMLKTERCLMWRKINGDGNCYYRCVMFALIENIILKNDINYLRNLIYIFNEKSKNKILMTMFTGLNLDIDLVKKCFIMIYLSITSKSHDPILKSYIVFYKMINNYKDFDYGLILFFKFILYEYINKNKKSTYSFKFQVLIGNLLPNDCQTDEGAFNFSHFYKNYLMKFYQYAEKIIIYITPFIFGKEIIVKYINENEGMDVDIQQYEFGKNLSYIDFENSKFNKIELLYKKTHYDLLYNNHYYESYKNIFKLTLFNFINNFQENICKICTKNNDKNSNLIKLESDINKSGIDGILINNKTIICHKCLYNEIKQNLILLFIFFIKKTKKYFLDNFSEQLSDFLLKKFTLSDKSMDITYSHAINALTLYRPKYNFDYIISKIKNEICVCCNANVNETNIYNNKKIKDKIILPCNCILCSESCIKELYYILMSSAYIKQEFVCFCNKKYSFEECLIIIEKYNEKKYDCKEMIEFLFCKKNKNKCFICLNQDINNKICYVIEPKFYLNHIIQHYICNNCYNKDENYLGQNIECGLCKRNHIIDKFYDKSKSDFVNGYDLKNNECNEHDSIEVKKKNDNKDIIKNKILDEDKKEIQKEIKNEKKIEIKNDNNNINKENKNFDDDDDNEEEERVTIIKIHKKKKK